MSSGTGSIPTRDLRFRPGLSRSSSWTRGGSLALLLSLPLGLTAADLSSSLRELRAVAAEGRGNPAASPAWRRVAAADARSLPMLLGAMDGANDYALNWIRGAIESVVQRELARGRALPTEALLRFARDTHRHPRARHLAFELVGRQDAALRDRLLPEFLNDPSPDLRRDSVQSLLNEGVTLATKDKPAAIAVLKKALASVRDADQVDAVAARLKELGQPVDLPKVFGWVQRWRLIGPFDNTSGTGFETAFPPESAMDPAAAYDGKTGKVKWREQNTTSDYGIVDFNQPFGALKSVTGYAVAEFWSDTARRAEIRLGCKDGWKVWANGKFLFGRDEYHRGYEIDQYRMPVDLQKGRNVILVKCCQNEQTEDWTKEWEFQLRVTDPSGAPIFSSR